MKPHVPFGSLAAEVAEIRAGILDAMTRVVDSGWFILGRELEAFERRFAEYSGAAHVAGCGNGTDAITLSLRAAQLGHGDEVITVANTCVPTIAGVKDAGCTVRLVDCDAETLLMDTDAVERAITPSTRAVVAVHLYGTMCDVARLSDICRMRGLILIEDCAQAHGASLAGVNAGRTGLVAAWSFYPSKNLGAYGDGGAVMTGDPEIDERVRRLRNYGQRVRYFHEEEGRNSRLDEIQAAILALKLEHLDKWNARRREIGSFYDEHLVGSGVRLVKIPAGAVPARHLYPVRVPATSRDRIRLALSDRGIETQIHYPVPVHQQPSYKRFHDGESYPVAERAAAELISIPLYPQMTADLVAQVVEEVRDVVRTER